MEELAALVRNAHGGEDAQGSCFVRDVLSGETAADSGLLMAMEYLCHQCGIEAVTAWGEGPRQSWLIVSTPDGYRHLPVDALYAPDGEELESPVALYTDQEMIGLGYEWPASLYPRCAEPS